MQSPGKKRDFTPEPVFKRQDSVSDPDYANEKDIREAVTEDEEKLKVSILLVLTFQSVIDLLHRPRVDQPESACKKLLLPFIAGLDLFDGFEDPLTEKDMLEFVHHLKYEFVEAGNTVCYAGETFQDGSDKFYIVIKGSVHMYSLNEESSPQVKAEEVVNQQSLSLELDANPDSATANDGTNGPRNELAEVMKSKAIKLKNTSAS